ncbi:MAG: TrkA family potassium uptake protein [bacterium]|nr:TrkA family potassium uptake protein [bacterium]
MATARQFAVIGLGRFGRSVALTLADMGHEVLGLDAQEEAVHEVGDRLTHVAQGDATDEEVLKAMGLRNFDVVVVAIGQDIQASILVTLMLKELGVKYVVAKARTEAHGKVLARVGADRVVFPERDMGARVAHNLVSSNVLDQIELSPDHTIVEIVAGEKFAAKTLRQLDLRARYGVNVMAIRKGDEVIVSPKADESIAEGDVLVVIGRDTSIRRLEEQ